MIKQIQLNFSFDGIFSEKKKLLLLKFNCETNNVVRARIEGFLAKLNIRLRYVLIRKTPLGGA